MWAHVTDYFKRASNSDAHDFRFTDLCLSKSFSKLSKATLFSKILQYEVVIICAKVILNMVLIQLYMKTWINSYCSTTASSTKGFYTGWYCSMSHTMIKQRDLSIKQLNNIVQYSFLHREPRKRKVEVMAPMITAAWL